MTETELAQRSWTERGPSERLGDGPLVVNMTAHVEKTIELSGDAPEAVTTKVDLEYSRSEHRFILSRYTVETLGTGGPGLRPRDLRRFELQPLITAAADHCLRTSFPRPGVDKEIWAPYWIDRPLGVEEDYYEVTEPESIELDAAHKWAICHITGRNPNATIAAAYGVSLSTAKRHVSRARELGYIDLMLGIEHGDD